MKKRVTPHPVDLGVLSFPEQVEEEEEASLK